MAEYSSDKRRFAVGSVFTALAGIAGAVVTAQLHQSFIRALARDLHVLRVSGRTASVL